MVIRAILLPSLIPFSLGDATISVAHSGIPDNEVGKRRKQGRQLLGKCHLYDYDERNI